MTLDDLRRLFLSPTLFRLDTILSPRLVPILYAVGLMSILLWAISHLFFAFGSNFGNGLWGLLEIIVFGLLWLIILRVACEALLVFFRAHSSSVDAIARTQLPSSLVDDVSDAIHDLAAEVEDPDLPPMPPVDPAPHIIRPTPSGPVTTPPPMPPDVPLRGPVVRRTARRTPPESKV